MLALSAFYSLFIYGAVNSSLSTLLPIIQKELGGGFHKAGLIFTIASLSSGFSSMFHGYLLEKLKLKKFILIMTLLLILAVLGFSVSKNIHQFIYLGLILGTAFSGLFFFANTVIARIYHDKTTRFMSGLHLFMGFGSLFMPFLIPYMLKIFIWRYVFILLIAAILLLIVYSQNLNLASIDRDSSVKVHKRDILKALRDRTTLYYGFLVFFYSAADLTITIWLVTYLNNFLGYDFKTSAHRLTLYYILLMAGRFAGFFVHIKIPRIKFALISASIGAFCLLLGLIKFNILISIVALFYSPVFPNIIAQVYSEMKDKSAVSIGVIFSFVSFGVAFSGYTVGYFSDLIGLQYGFSLSLVFISIAILIMSKKVLFTSKNC